ncbi:MAG: response regulator [Polyangiaceae bacterium]
MSKGRVLVIDDDEWVCRLLAVAMRDAGFEVTVTENAVQGFETACSQLPDCIVCDIDLPDHDGYWVARQIRSHQSKISSTPFVFLSGLDDREHRLEGFQVGADAYLTKPFRIDEVVAQVDALIAMATRLKRSRATLASIPPSAAMFGDLSQMSVGTVLTLLDLERRSGRLELRTDVHRCAFVIVAGHVAAATMDDGPVAPLQAIRESMSWQSGKFSFSPGSSDAATNDLSPINALLMEAARLEDESNADRGESPGPSSRIASWMDTFSHRGQRPATGQHQAITSRPGEGEASERPPRPTSSLPPPIPAAGRPAVQAALPPPASETPMPGPALPPPAPIPGARGSSPQLQPPPPRAGSSPQLQTTPSPGQVKPNVPGPRPAPPKPPIPRFATPTGAVKQTPLSESPKEVPRHEPIKLDSLRPEPTKPDAPKPDAPRPIPEPTPLPSSALPNRPEPPRLRPLVPLVPSGKTTPKPLPTTKTAFGAMRSLSPAKGIPIVKQPTAPTTPAKPESSPESLDTGWSSPPPAGDPDKQGNE